MAITFPRTDIMSVKFSEQVMHLIERQELSRTAGGITIAKSFGVALWNFEATTITMRKDDALAYEAKVRSLDGSVGTFLAGDLRRRFPKSAPAGDFDDSAAAIHTLDDNGKALRVDGLSVGLVLSEGDYLSFTYSSTPTRYALHQIMETVTVDGDGLSPLFEVRPHIRPGAAVDDPVTLKTPQALFMLEPGSVSLSHLDPFHSTVSFRAIQTI